jgi:hypothetical protein
MKADAVEAAKAFLRDAYEAENRRSPTQDELLEWALLQWQAGRRQPKATPDLLRRKGGRA